MRLSFEFDSRKMVLESILQHMHLSELLTSQDTQWVQDRNFLLIKIISQQAFRTLLASHSMFCMRQTKKG